VLQSLFIVGKGVLSITQDGIEGETEVMRLGRGDHFGEFGLLTGAPATAKISALVLATVYELARADVSLILEGRPQVAQELCRALARRQTAGRPDRPASSAQSASNGRKRRRPAATRAFNECGRLPQRCPSRRP
jgi:CRP-like cAMP-binding protein